MKKTQNEMTAEFNDSEIDYLIAAYFDGVSLQEMALRTARSEDAVKAKIEQWIPKRLARFRKEGKPLEYQPAVRYSYKEIEYLMKNFETGSKEVIVRHLGRSWGGIVNKIKTIDSGMIRRRQERGFDDCGGVKGKKREPLAEEELREMAKLWNDGVPVAAIAQLLGISDNMVGQYRRRLELPRRPGANNKKIQNWAKIREEYSAGHTVEDLARKYKITPKHLKGRLGHRKAGYDVPPILRPDEIELIARYYLSGCSDTCIGERIGRSKQTIAKARARNGITGIKLDDEEVVLVLAKDLTAEQIAKKLEYSSRRIKAFLDKEGE